MIRLHTIAAAVALTAIVSAAPVYAGAVKVSSEITNLKIELIDLLPDDGIAPSVGFGREQFYSASAYSVFDYTDPDNETKWTGSPGSTAISRSFGGTAGWATKTAVGSNAQVWTIENLREGSFSSQGRKDLRWYSLSHGTVMRVSGTVTLNNLRTADERTRTYAEVTVSDGPEGGGTPVILGKVWELDNVDGTLTEDFSFDMTSERKDFGHINLWSHSFAQATAVPEPATYGMLLAGLAIVGLRRRSKRLR